MLHRFTLFNAAVLLTFAASSLPAQDRVVALPGADSSTGEMKLLPSTGLETSWTASVSPGAFKALMSPNGLQLYVFSNTEGAGRLTAIGPNGGVVAAAKLIGTHIIDAAITPDGKRLIVLSPELRIYDIVGDSVTLVTSAELGENLTGLAVSHDSRRAYVIDPVENQFLAVDLEHPVNGIFSKDLSSTPSAIAVGPNGLIYVSAEGGLLEFDDVRDVGNLLLRRTIELPPGMDPGKPVFTPDGKRMIVADAHSVAETAAVYEFDTGELSFVLGTAFRQVLAPAADGFYGIGVDGKLWAVPFGAVLEPVGTSFTFQDPVISAAVSNEASKARNLYVITEQSGSVRTLSRVDLNSYVIAESTPVAGNTIAYAAAGTTGTPAKIHAFNTVQTVPAGARIAPLVVRVIGSSDRALKDVPVQWTAETGLTAAGSLMANTNIPGYAQAVYTAPQVAGEYHVTATAGSQSAIFTINVSGTSGGGDGGTGSASRVVVISGQGQVSWQGWDPFKPITVQVRNDDGTPTEDAHVTWTLTPLKAGVAWILGAEEAECSGTTDRQICPTDAEGKSSIEFRSVEVPLQSPYSQFKLVASATRGAVSLGVATVYMTVLPPNANLSRVVDVPGFGTTITLRRGEPVAGAMQIRVWTDPGTPLPNVGVTVSASFSGFDVKCVGGTVFTNALGIATCNLVASGPLGETGLIIDVGAAGQISSGIKAKVTPGPPGLISIVSGNNQSGGAGATLPDALVAKVQDGAGNPLPGAPVNWEVIPAGAATLSSTSSTAGEGGLISTRVTLGSAPGQFTVRAKAGTVQADFKATVVVPIIAFTKDGGDNQSAETGTAFADPITVKVMGASAPLQNIPITFAVATGATLSATSVTTGADGKASVTVTAGDTAGAVTVTATTPGMDPLTFNLRVDPPGPVLTPASFLNGASFEPGVSSGAITAIVSERLISGVPAMPVGSCISGGVLLGPLPLTVAGMEVQFADRKAPMFAVCRTGENRHQINVQAPFELDPATLDVIVRTGVDTESPSETVVSGVQIVAAKPGVFQTASEGQTIAIAYRPNGSMVTPSNPALQGEIVRIYATGLGQVVPRLPTKTNQMGGPGQYPWFTPVVTIAGTAASGVTAEYAETMIGAFVVTFSLPAVSAGNAQLRLDMIDNTGQAVAGSTVVLPVQ